MFYGHCPFTAASTVPYRGHAISRDLVVWQHLPEALAPSHGYDAGGCFSGTVAVNGQDSQRKGYLAGAEGDCMEIEVELEPGSCKAEEVGLLLRCSADGSEYTRVLYRPGKGLVDVDCSSSGEAFEGRKGCLLPEADMGDLKLRIYIDTSSVEVFIENTGQVLTYRVYPKADSRGLDLYAAGGSAVFRKIKLWKLRAWHK